MEDLFSQHQAPEQQAIGSGPLAHRMRPDDLSEFFGQTKILGQGTPLWRWIETDRVPSLILWGPPGCGKTTLAQLISRKTRSAFKSLSAVTHGAKDLREKAEEARQLLKFQGRRTILFVDEIHRLNKGQQDALLPFVEDGSVTLIGATTENPSFELNQALLSRARVVRLERLSEDDLSRILERAVQNPDRGIGGWLKLSSEALRWIASISEGDARRALTTLENIATAAAETEDRELGIEELKALLSSASGLDKPRASIPYDKTGEEHHNVVSAFIKSMRASDPDAAVYYLARMIEGGEDPLFIARRMVVFASEDIGNADPRALSVAIAAQQAVDFIGMPEGRISLGQAAVYLAIAPKSRASYDAIGSAIEEVQKTGALPVPMHLRNAVTSLMKAHGYGKRAAEGSEGAAQGNLPEAVAQTRFYEPWDSGLEKTIRAAREKNQ